MVGRWRVLDSVKMIAEANRIFEDTHVSMFQKEASRSHKANGVIHDNVPRSVKKTNEYLNKIGVDEVVVFFARS